VQAGRIGHAHDVPVKVVSAFVQVLQFARKNAFDNLLQRLVFIRKTRNVAVEQLGNLQLRRVKLVDNVNELRAELKMFIVAEVV